MYPILNVVMTFLKVTNKILSFTYIITQYWHPQGPWIKFYTGCAKSHVGIWKLNNFALILINYSHPKSILLRFYCQKVFFRIPDFSVDSIFSVIKVSDLLRFGRPLFIYWLIFGVKKEETQTSIHRCFHQFVRSVRKTSFASLSIKRNLRAAARRIDCCYEKYQKRSSLQSQKCNFAMKIFFSYKNNHKRNI